MRAQKLLKARVALWAGPREMVEGMSEDLRAIVSAMETQVGP